MNTNKTTMKKPTTNERLTANKLYMQHSKAIADVLFVSEISRKELAKKLTHTTISALINNDFENYDYWLEVRKEVEKI